MRRVVLTNRVPDLASVPLIEDTDYLAYDSIAEMLDKVRIIMGRPHLFEAIAQSGYEKVKPFTYKNRVIQMLKDCGYDA